MLERHELGQVGPQRLGTIGTDCIGSEVKVLEGRELGQVGPQRFGTFGTDCIVSEVKVLKGRELGQVGPQRLAPRRVLRWQASAWRTPHANTGETNYGPCSVRTRSFSQVRLPPRMTPIEYCADRIHIDTVASTRCACQSSHPTLA